MVWTLGCGGVLVLVLLAVLIATLIDRGRALHPAGDAAPGGSRSETSSTQQNESFDPNGPIPHPHLTALEQLDTLEVRPRGSRAGYERERFAWRADTDGNGCDTRHDVLRRDLTEWQPLPDSHGCRVATGVFESPFTGDVYAFVRHPTNVDVDHVVALSDAWQSGAHRLPARDLVSMANDPLNLIAVEPWLNQAKGDGDAATWLPPQRAYHCEYVARQIAVKAKYGLWVKTAERDAMHRVLETCPGQPALRDDPWPDPPVRSIWDDWW